MAANTELSPINRFYSGKSIVVTGSTGFIGKVLIEKLLYSCPDVKKIYLLIRSSNGMSPHSRMLAMISQRPFDMRLKRDFILSKLEAIDCDLSKSQLGLSADSQSLLIDDVNIIFHVAASVKFDAPLEVNMRHNVVATKELLEFATHFKQLACFIHVSTAYSNCQLHQIDERIYPMDVPDDPMTLKVTSDMLDNRPNTYTYTKAIAESFANQYAGRMNVVVVRPSIVMSALSEPVEGWVDTINGPVGLSVLGALGILQKIKVNSGVVFDLIPVDTVCRALLSIAWAATEKRSEFTSAAAATTTTTSGDALRITENNNEEQATVFNLTTGNENPCSFYRYFSIGREEAYKKPSTRALRPLLTIPKQTGMNPLQYWIHKILTHLLFAYLIDLILSIVGQKRMVVKAVNRMHHANEVFDYFCSNQWTFNTDNVKRLRELQSKHDKITYDCDVRKINWNFYAKIAWLGCRRFILKESDDSVDYARMRYKAVCWIYYSAKIFLLLALTSIASYCLDSRAILWMVMMPIYGVVYLV